MKKSDMFPFLLLLVLLSAGCSGSGSSGQGPDALPSTPLPVAGESPAPPPAGSGPSGPVGAIVVYSENQSVLNAVQADGQQRTAIAGDATYRGATEDGWVIFVQDQELISMRIADGTLRILDDTPGSKHFRGVFDTNYVMYEKHNGTDGQSSLHLVRADGSDRLVPVAPQPRPRPLEFIAVTPSRRILYEVCDLLIEEDGVRCTDRRLLSAKLDGSDERLVLPGAPLIRHITADDRLVYDRAAEAGTVMSHCEVRRQWRQNVERSGQFLRRRAAERTDRLQPAAKRAARYCTAWPRTVHRRAHWQQAGRMNSLRARRRTGACCFCAGAHSSDASTVWTSQPATSVQCRRLAIAR